MRDDTPTVYLLAGPSGPGKTAYVQALAERGVVRLAAGTALTDETAAALVTQLEAGRDVMVEYDSADQSERDRCQHLADEAHAAAMIINFSRDHDALSPRLA
jgi:predicted kinase